MLFEKGAHGRVAFRNPGTFVEQPRRLEKGREIQFDTRPAKTFQTLACRHEQRRIVFVAEELQLLGARHAEAQGRNRCIAETPRIRVCGIEAFRRPEHRRGIFGVQRKDRDAIERATRGHDTVGAQAADARLEAEQVIERRRYTAGARRVGAEGEARESGRHGDRGTGTRAAGNVTAIETVAAGPVGRAYADQAGCELIEIGLAERNRARGDELRDDRGGARRRVRIGGTAGCRCDVGQINVVLDHERDAKERQRVGGVLRERRDVAGHPLARQSGNPHMAFFGAIRAPLHGIDEFGHLQLTAAIRREQRDDAEIRNRAGLGAVRHHFPRARSWRCVQSQGAALNWGVGRPALRSLSA